jgi:hypothetical protein
MKRFSPACLDGNISAGLMNQERFSDEQNQVHIE